MPVVRTDDVVDLGELTGDRGSMNDAIDHIDTGACATVVIVSQHFDMACTAAPLEATA